MFPTDGDEGGIWEDMPLLFLGDDLKGVPILKQFETGVFALVPFRID